MVDIAHHKLIAYVSGNLNVPVLFPYYKNQTCLEDLLWVMCLTKKTIIKILHLSSLYLQNAESVHTQALGVLKI
jgi:hypothetical protein